MRALGSDALIRSLWFAWPVDSRGPAPDAEAPALPTAEVLASPTAVRTLRGRSVICPIFGQITLRPLSVRTQSVGASKRNPAGPVIRRVRESKDRASWWTSKRI